MLDLSLCLFILGSQSSSLTYLNNLELSAKSQGLLSLGANRSDLIGTFLIPVRTIEQMGLVGSLVECYLGPSPFPLPTPLTNPSAPTIRATRR